ncbi:TonB-linked SusC/RagA family outer membrane protein [Dyadobacter jejuensis]|uniref:TonB-linked SusC/RagA family outer membrane protein n=1 Tax=Dyadobacter jejuensis TaxID=1082580 RepID=A0A316API8_9BACT|nr:SusC/RagA family TonB-linked outer membrane protein [Dyadobacter jejuensis]PWJ59411.1 TonB-linked SusC/RagA family outer membrane protein [Dyadobacter jejuensis]
MRKYFLPPLFLFFYLALFIPFTVFGNPDFGRATSPFTPARPSLIDVSGTVLSAEDRSPIPGVSIMLKGSTIGTTTDVSGHFNIQVPGSEAVLIFSSVGFVNQELVVGTRTHLEITLETDQKALSEVVVVGYGTQKKSQLTGAISSVGAKEIGELPVTNARQALQGRVAGVDVVQNGSNPGAGVSVRIRGRRSINASNDPLYVVDGIPMAGSIDDINPNDIASMEVLKDASATAIYGSRGANGVVIVTTKRGTTGKMSVTYDGYYGVSKELSRIDVMNGAEFAEYKRESRRAVGTYDDSDPTAADLKLFSAVELEGIAEGRSTDYQDEILRTGSIQSHQIGIQGGSEKTQFAVSSNYFKDVGIIKTMDFTRYSLRINLDHHISKNIRIGISSLGVYSVNHGASSFLTSSNGFTPLALTLRENPLGKAYNDDGTLIFLPTADGLQSNPASEVVKGNNIAETETIRLFNSIYAEWKILPNLKYRFNFGPDFTVQSFGRFWGTYTNDRRGGDPRALLDKGRRFNYTLENVLTYAKVFNQKHDLNITALHSVQQDNYQTSGISVTGLPVESMSYHNLGAASSISSVSSALTEWALQSFMARVNYSYQDKYLLTVTGRYDGSSRFGVNTKYGFFPSAAVGWNLSDEDFLKTARWISQLKLRASWGKTGNTAIDPYQTQTLLSRSAYAYLATAAYGYAPSTIGNADLRWESTASTNFGIDYAF